MPRASSTDMPAQLFAPPVYRQASAGQVSCPSSPGDGIVRNTQRSFPLRASYART